MPIAALALVSTLMSGSVLPAQTAPPRVSIVAACTAAAPAEGASISGPVLQVIDGQTLCVAKGPTPDQWVRVRLADVYDRENRSALMAATFAKDVICNVERRDDEGVVGRCSIDGAPLTQVVASAPAQVQAASWR